MMKERYNISGMTCSACSSHVEKAVNKLAGVEKASVNLLTETMEVSYDQGRLTGEEIMAAVEKAGYGASRITGGGRVQTAVGRAGNRGQGRGSAGTCPPAPATWQRIRTEGGRVRRGRRYPQQGADMSGQRRAGTAYSERLRPRPGP